MRRACLAVQGEGTLPPVSVVGACQALGLARSGYYRSRNAKSPAQGAAPSPCRVPGRALTGEQQKRVLEQLHSERFMDKAPPQVYATLLIDRANHHSGYFGWRRRTTSSEAQRMERKRHRNSATHCK